MLFILVGLNIIMDVHQENLLNVFIMFMYNFAPLAFLFYAHNIYFSTSFQYYLKILKIMKKIKLIMLDLRIITIIIIVINIHMYTLDNFKARN